MSEQVFSAEHALRSVVLTMVEILKKQGMEAPGTCDALNAYQVLEAAKSQAIVFELPLGEIGLADFDPNILLTKP